jgi:AcrR family transcriptional regulator
MILTARDRLVTTAARLFAEQGFRATGIDTILEEAGVAKATLYAHFDSKNDLIVAAIEHTSRTFGEWARSEVARRAERPHDRVLVLFDVLAEWFESPEFRGCFFIRAAGEFAELSDPIHHAAANAKNGVHGFIRELCAALGGERQVQVEESLVLLAEGAITMAQLSGSSESARTARRAAELLLAS